MRQKRLWPTNTKLSNLPSEDSPAVTTSMSWTKAKSLHALSWASITWRKKGFTLSSGVAVLRNPYTSKAGKRWDLGRWVDPSYVWPENLQRAKRPALADEEPLPVVAPNLLPWSSNRILFPRAKIIVTQINFFDYDSHLVMWIGLGYTLFNDGDLYSNKQKLLLFCPSDSQKIKHVKAKLGQSMRHSKMP